MKVALEFLPKIRLNAIQASFALNLVLFSCCCFFSFILFILVFYSNYALFSFLLKCSIVFKESVLPVLTLKRKSLYVFKWAKSACQIKKFGAHSLKLTDLCHICMKSSCSCSLCIYTIFKSKLIAAIKKMAVINVTSLNKTDIHSLYKNACLISKWLQFLQRFS